MNFEQQVTEILDELKEVLITKNKKYGNSALEPVRIFSKATPTEQLLVRLDDKLSRLANQQSNEDEDVILDLMGYLVLLRMSEDKPVSEEHQQLNALEENILARLVGTNYILLTITSDGYISVSKEDFTERELFNSVGAFERWADKIDKQKVKQR